MEETQARHRKEQKELQARITSKKKNATKKTRKGVNDECERLEHELREKHQTEIAALAVGTSEDVPAMSNLDINDSEIQPESNLNDGVAAEIKDQQTEAADSGKQQDGNSKTQTLAAEKGKKPNRQKQRMQRKAAELEAQILDAEKEAASMPDQRKQEMEGMKKQMENHGLIESMIRPDGHCLYSACAYTIAQDTCRNYKDVRIATAQFIDAHPDDFAPFMEEPLDSYTNKIKNTAEWGGHLELQAIAKAFSVAINVLQADGHIEQIQPETKPGKSIWLAYYKHSFGLGEHYNALTKSSES